MSASFAASSGRGFKVATLEKPFSAFAAMTSCGSSGGRRHGPRRQRRSLDEWHLPPASQKRRFRCRARRAEQKIGSLDVIRAAACRQTMQGRARGRGSPHRARRPDGYCGASCRHRLRDDRSAWLGRPQRVPLLPRGGHRSTRFGCVRWRRQAVAIRPNICLTPISSSTPTKTSATVCATCHS